MRRIIHTSVLALAAALGVLSQEAAAQGATSRGPLVGQNWQLGQDLDNARNTTSAPVGTAPDRIQRAQRQQRQNRPITGAGRPVATVPTPTPTAAAAPRPPTRPPTRPVTPLATPQSAAVPSARTQPAPATQPSTPGELPASTTAPGTPRSAAPLPSPGQSTGAARAMPASR